MDRINKELETTEIVSKIFVFALILISVFITYLLGDWKLTATDILAFFMSSILSFVFLSILMFVIAYAFLIILEAITDSIEFFVNLFSKKMKK
ncbi:hypothetical protein [Hydrogenothermus marinus]|uniref:Uncharacterized protein n=1 Tax=Hydrogenothermus marinus TaxID=133270 RepID=A0A3M0BUG5_9AQUI|nr:hypothetical protein [Hydrogenothermus marinus]RMB00057.1 hypothetical protein CLV39_0051 [Hydrogenothermus marinus]